MCLMFGVKEPRTKAHTQPNVQMKAAGFAQEGILNSSFGRNHTYLAGITDGAGGLTIKCPLCDTGIIITLKGAPSDGVALTGQARAAVHKAFCSYTF
jgi:hypothetical protein